VGASYYGMRALLVLYITTSTLEMTQEVLRMDKSGSIAFYGWYTMLVYLMSIPGGMIADKLIGQKKA
jgi:POT family proton-dependent oligopeptide transporter